MIEWSTIHAVIFDVDGTLYEQKGLRRRMARDLLIYYAFSPWRYRELLSIKSYRHLREKMAGQCRVGLEEYLIEEVAWERGVDKEIVRQSVASWILERPLKYLARYRRPGLLSFIEALEMRGIRLGVFSDYPAEKKLKSLGLPPMECVCATDPGVDALKPSPCGLLRLMRLLEVEPEHCLFIGDRCELDGECARAAGIEYLILTDTVTGNREFSDYRLLGEELPDILCPSTR